MNNTTDYEVQQYGIFREDITLAEFDYGPNNPYGGLMEGTVAFQRGWYILDLCHEFHAQYLDELRETSLRFTPTRRPHISIIKREAPSAYREQYGSLFVGEVVQFTYLPGLQTENGCHLWVACYSKRLCEIREFFAVPTLRDAESGTYKVVFHTTIAKLLDPLPPTRRPQWRLTPSTHIDATTLLQHV